MKKWIAMLLAMMMLLCACGALAEDAADGAEPYGDGDGVVSAEQLAALYQWLNVMNAETKRMVSYDTVCAAAGAPGKVLEKTSDDVHGADWTDGTRDVTVTFKNENGFWYVSAIVTTIDSAEYLEADISGLPFVGNRAAGSSETAAQTLETKVKPNGPSLDVTAEVPTEYWFAQAKMGEVRFLNCLDESRTSYQPAAIRLAFYATQEDLAADRDKCDNVQETEYVLNVLGQEMKGWSYTKSGMDLVEFEGQLGDDLWIAVRFYDIIPFPGTEAEAILNSLTWAAK